MPINRQWALRPELPLAQAVGDHVRRENVTEAMHHLKARRDQLGEHGGLLQFALVTLGRLRPGSPAPSVESVGPDG
jgi:hypothetical protein